MGEPIRTYSLAERAGRADFSIHDERTLPRLERGHRHEYFQIQLNLRGRARNYIGGTVRTLEPGSVAFIVPFRAHRVVREAGSRFYVINFGLGFLRPGLELDPLELDQRALARAPELAPFVFQERIDFALHGSELGRAVQGCRAMMREIAQPGLCSEELIRAHLLLLLATVGRRHESALLACAGAAPSAPREALARVARHIRENLARRITLAGAAAAADLSPDYLAHWIRKQTGRTLTELVTERRMAKARELLAHTGMRVSEIARAVGFPDEAYFARRFRQWEGTAPSEYRRRIGAGGR